MEGSDCNLKLFDKLSKRRDKEMKEKKIILIQLCTLELKGVFMLI